VPCRAGKKAPIVNVIRQLADLFDAPQERVRLMGLVLVLLVGSGLEILGIGVFLPFVRLISEPAAVAQHPRFGPMLRTLGLEDRESIILAASLALIGLFALKNTYLAIQWRVLFKFVYGKMARTARDIFAGYLESPYTFHLRHNSAELMQNVTIEVKNAFSVVVRQVLITTVEIVVTVGVAGFLIFVSPAAALAGFAAVGSLAWLVSRLSSRRLEQLGKMREVELGRVYRVLQESFGAFKEIRVLRRENYFLRGFERSENLYVDALRDSSLLSQYPRLAIETIAVLALTGLAGFLLLQGQGMPEALSTLVVFGVAIIRLVPAAARITAGVNQIRFFAPSVQTVHDSWLARKELMALARKTEPEVTLLLRREIALDSVSYSYPDGPDPVLRQLSLSIPRGQSVGFVGSSGAGKTTLLHLLLGLLQPSSGRILVDGTDIHANVRAWQRQIGFIPQDPYLLDDTIRRNVAFGVPDDEIDEEAVWRALDAAQLLASIDTLDKGLETLAGERGVRMSGGQGQRLAIARALYHDPEVLILDEATSSLDYETEARIVGALQEIKGDKTLIIVSHRHQAVRDCDIIHVLEGGRLAASGRFEEILSSRL